MDRENVKRYGLLAGCLLAAVGTYYLVVFSLDAAGGEPTGHAKSLVGILAGFVWSWVGGRVWVRISDRG